MSWKFVKGFTFISFVSQKRAKGFTGMCPDTGEGHGGNG